MPRGSRIPVATLLSRAGTAGLVVLVALDLARVLDLAGPWLALAAACLALWVVPPVVALGLLRRRMHRGDRASWRSFEERLAAEQTADERDERAA